jgi:hypothetical protein
MQFRSSSLRRQGPSASAWFDLCAALRRRIPAGLFLASRRASRFEFTVGAPSGAMLLDVIGGLVVLEHARQLLPALPYLLHPCSRLRPAATAQGTLLARIRQLLHALLCLGHPCPRLRAKAKAKAKKMDERSAKYAM